MTDVRPISSGGKGIFATQPFQVGDVVLEEIETLAVLGCSVNEDQGDEPSLLSPVKSNNRKKQENSKSKPTLYHSILPPSSIPSHHVGNFRGMVQSVVYFTKQSQTKNTEVLARLFQLYHPSETPSEDEKEIVQVANEALVYLQKYAADGSALKSFVTDHPTDTVKLMLVWACNSFEGGQIYEKQSRINHSCNPNAVVQPALVGSQSGQIIRAAAPIAVGDEVTISYLGLFLYADGHTRREQLLRSKHFTCQCLQCRELPDIAAAIPCPFCHERHGRYLDEDVQYDDEGSVHYAVPPTSMSNAVECQYCHQSKEWPSESNSDLNHVLKLARSVSNKIAEHLQEREGRRKSHNVDNDDMALEEEWEEQLLQLSSTVLGARHWATNMMLLVRLDRSLQLQHSNMITVGSPPDITDVAESIDSLERLCRFVNGLNLKMEMGHLLSHTVIGVARTLVSLGDTKSKKYASEWLEKIKDYVDVFETEGMKKVVKSLEVAWLSNESEPISMEDANDDDNGNKKARTC